MIGMRRHEFITLLGGVAAWPLAARAQPEQMRRVGIFMHLSEQDQEGQTRVAAFRKGMQDLGWIEGRNLRSDIRWTAGDPARMRRYAAELVGLVKPPAHSQSAAESSVRDTSLAAPRPCEKTNVGP